MKEPVWVFREVVLMLHEQSLAQFGGSAGVRDEGLLDSALGRPQHRFAYGKPTLFNLAANYAFGLVKNHPFIDGNKRTGFIVALTFLEFNGLRYSVIDVEAIVHMLAIDAGRISESTYTTL